MCGVRAHARLLHLPLPGLHKLKVYPLAVPFGCDSGWSLEKLMNEGKLQCEIN